KSAPYNRLLGVLNVTFASLNQSNPNLTKSCWLCYNAEPPFYEGVALSVAFTYSWEESPHQCRWDIPRKGITLSQVTGQGKCFG
ncbi:ENV2 protein, partial [Phainopepla nitens]|nr:ENV2 protein [Phainopepla nitens]